MTHCAVFQTSTAGNKGLSSDGLCPSSESDSLGLRKSLPLFPSSSSFTQTPVDPRRTRRPMVWITTSSPSSSLRRTSKTTSKQN